MSEIDFKGLNHALRYRTRELLPEWLPGGKIVGKEYTCSDLNGGSGSSLKVNVESGVWKDFASDVAGGDLISLYAAIKGFSQVEAARALQSYVGTSVETTRQSKVRPSDERLGPPPPGVGKPVFTHFKFGEPEQIWTYKDSDGSVLFYVSRHFNSEDKRKEFTPHSWSLASKKWVRKIWPAPRPLYGLDWLKKYPDKAVLVVEGEKACDAARKFIPASTYVVVSWPSGSSASMLTDWKPLHGRKVLLWPDADLKTYPKDNNLGEKKGQLKPEHEQPGFIAMQKIAAELVDHCPEVKILKTFKCSPVDGWDAADALAEGMDWEKFKAWAKPRAEIYKKNEKSIDLNEPPAYLSEAPPHYEEPFSGSDFNPEAHGYYHQISTREGPKWVPLYSLMAKDILKVRDHVFDSKGHYRYVDGFWEPVSDDYLRNMIVTVNTAHVVPTHIDNFAKIIKSFNYLGAMKFKETDHRLNIENGILDLETYEIEPHSKEYFFKWKIPVAYDKAARCPKWIEFLESVFEGDQTLIDAAQRIFGYILMGGRPFLHRAFVLYGEGRNGKSVFLNTLMKIIGEANFSTVSLSNLDKPFSAVMLDGKIANILEETPTDKINPEIFKAAVGGGYVQMSRKHMDEYSAKVSARFIFACNKLPIFGDNTTGNLDRLFFLPFNRYYSESERDGDLEVKLEAELPGILNWSIEGIKLVRAEKRIEEPVPALKLKEQYQQESDSVYSWMQERVEFSDSFDGTHTDTLYKDYGQICESSGLRAVSKINFARSFGKHGKRAAQNVGAKLFTQDRIYVEGTRARGFLSCRLIQATNYASLIGKNRTDRTDQGRMF